MLSSRKLPIAMRYYMERVHRGIYSVTIGYLELQDRFNVALVVTFGITLQSRSALPFMRNESFIILVRSYVDRLSGTAAISHRLP